MIYCHECGEKITENDAFCPFCGISITPIVPIEDANADISDENTVAVSGAELEKLTKNAGLEHMNIITEDDSVPQVSDESSDKENISETPPVELPITSTSQLKEIEPAEETGESQTNVEVSKNVEQETSNETEGEEEIDLEDSLIIENFGVVVPETVPEKEDEQIIEDAEKELENANDITPIFDKTEPEIKDFDETPPIDTEISSEEAAKIEDDWQNQAEETEVETSDSAENIEAEVEEEKRRRGEEENEPKEIVEAENEIIESNKSEEVIETEDEEVVFTEDEKIELIETEDEQTEIKDTVENIETEIEAEEIPVEESQSEEFEQKIEPPEEPLPLGEDEVKMPTVSYDSSDVQDIEENKIYADEKLKSILDDDSANVLLDQIRDSKSEIEQSKPTLEQNDTGQRKLEELQDKISIPESPLDETDEQNTKYDSVKIMGDSEPEVAENEAESSFTTPNFENKNDTDGKKGLKLKPLDEGTVLNNRYEIIRKIGGGGMGAVYMATDKNLGETLRAVKEMVQSYIEESQQEKAIEDFKREATILSTLDHPAIPTIYDYFYDEGEGRFYLVMKYISGGDLSQRLRSASESRVDETNVVEWAIQVADVLDYLHNLQPPIVYRDLKPANVMLDSNSGRIMLIDFGIARSINKEEKGVTAVGTMGYAPPELFSGNVEPRSDIYSLGSTIFHLLTGADPQSNPLLIFDFQKHPRPRQINPSLTDQMEKIIMQAVEYNAQNRFPSAAAMRDDLIKHLRHLKAGKVSYGISESPAAAALEDQQVFCGFCGQKIVATDMFCAFCGSKQPLAQQGVHSPDYVSPLMTAKLFVIGTNELESPAYSLEKDSNILGRRDPITQIFPEVDLSKFDPQTKISRRHARIWREGGKFLVEDLGSSNGTMVIPIAGESYKLRPHNPHNLINGEKVKVGDTMLHFVIE